MGQSAAENGLAMLEATVFMALAEDLARSVGAFQLTKESIRLNKFNCRFMTGLLF